MHVALISDYGTIDDFSLDRSSNQIFESFSYKRYSPPEQEEGDSSISSVRTFLFGIFCMNSMYFVPTNPEAMVSQEVLTGNIQERIFLQGTVADSGHIFVLLNS